MSGAPGQVNDLRLHTTVRNCAAVLALGLALTACGTAGALPAETGTESPSASNTPLRVPSTTRVPSTSAAALEADGREAKTLTDVSKLPVAARPETPRGASEFTRYFMNRLDQGLMTANPDLVDDLFLESCSTCVALTADMRDLKRLGHHHVGHTLKVTMVRTSMFDSQRRVVQVHFDQYSVPVVDTLGRRVSTTKPGKGDFIAVLKFEAHWRISDLGRTR